MNIEISPKEYERRLNWHDAILYCQLLSIDGKDDWRLPTKAELDYMYENKNDYTDDDVYWSSNEGSSGHYAWGQSLIYGGQFGFDKQRIYYVRAVRNL